MGSRMMHLLIGKRISEELELEGGGSFLLGSLAPDAASPKDRSHFYRGEVWNYTRRIDYVGFLDKYQRYGVSDYILGYYTHLIADDLWLKGFYLPWLKNRLEHDTELLNRYHGDFRILNGQLLNVYGYSDLQWEIDWKGMVETDEVTSEDIKELYHAVRDDFTYSLEDLEKPLQVFTCEQIIGYIETSVEQGIQRVRALKKSAIVFDPSKNPE